METKNDGVIEIDLLQIVRALWSKVWMIILATIMGGALMAVYTVGFVTPMYTASTLMYVNSSNLDLGDKLSITQSDLSAAKSLINTYAVILNSRNTLEDVIEEAELPYSYGQLSEMIRATSVNGTEVFRISVTNPDPEMAARIANTIARVLPDKIGSIVDGTSARIVDLAVIPTNYTSPNVVSNIIKGALVGFVLVCAVIVVQELLDDMVYDTDYLIQTYDLPVLATVPDLMESNNGSYKRYYRYQNSSSAKKDKR